ncbi:MAG: hypothetical protein NT123_11520 [Proteobacteria bacterium]|nr:hypothetical protein [Pseudomonadota bacterium]
MAMTSGKMRASIACRFMLAAGLLVSGCADRQDITEKQFVGKWKSSKLTTPMYLYANGEWEIKTEEGGILQYGVWEYKDKRIVWSFKIDSQIGHDVNPVLSATPREFRLLEADKSTTIFSRID